MTNVSQTCRRKERILLKSTSRHPLTLHMNKHGAVHAYLYVFYVLEAVRKIYELKTVLV